jgi:DHA3 family tetracycline resistance protein-like MFS transporter
VCFVLQVPTGALADSYSRRACVVGGAILSGAGFMLEGLVPRFGAILLAQVVWGSGATLISGAEEAWIAGEVGEDHLGRVFLRGAQTGQIGSLAGAALSVALGSIRLNVPIVTGGALIASLGAFLLVTMPEHIARESTLHTQRPTWRGMGATVARGARLVRGSPLLLTILALPLFFGISGEGFDRLSPDHFIQDFRFPPLGPLKPVVWFGIMAIGATLLGLACTEVVRRRVTLNGYPAIARTLSALSVLHVA